MYSVLGWRKQWQKQYIAIGKTDLFYNSMGLCGSFTPKHSSIDVLWQFWFDILLFLSNLSARLSTLVCHILQWIVIGRTATSTHFKPIMNKPDAIAYLCDNYFLRFTFDELLCFLWILPSNLQGTIWWLKYYLSKFMSVKNLFKN